MPVKTMLLEVENLYAITESSILYVQPHRSLTGLLPAILQLHPGYESNSLAYVLRINPGKVPEIVVQETSSGWGTLIIDKIVYETEDQWGFKSKKTIPIQFAEIPKAKQVAELARKVLVH